MGDILPIVGRRASVGRSRRVARYLRGRLRLIEVSPLRRAEEIIDFHRRLRLVQEVGRVHLHRSEEHTYELQSLMRISYAVFCLTTQHSPPPLTSISMPL